MSTSPSTLTAPAVAPMALAGPVFASAGTAARSSMMSVARTDRICGSSRVRRARWRQTGVNETGARETSEEVVG
jgi:hypothetical protein